MRADRSAVAERAAAGEAVPLRRDDGSPVISLLASQNSDGGWPYQRGGPSWTEPTAYAVLALISQRSAVEPVAHGLRWLKAAQLADGGWPPQPVVRQSTWVTAVAALLGPGLLGESVYHRAIAWIVRETDEDSTLLIRVRQFLTGRSQSVPGWPWFPRTSAWVTPTALSVLALRKAVRCANSPLLRTRVETGVLFLLTHTCSGGGWNHGAARALGYDAHAYPETTGVALLALAGQEAPQIRKACHWARRQLPTCRTSEGASWLRLGLLAHGHYSADAPGVTRTPRTIQNAAVAILAEGAIQGRNPFLEQIEWLV